MKKLTYLFALAGLLGMNSCNDYLDIVPKGNKIPTTLADYEALLRNEYTISQTPVANALYLLNDQYMTKSSLGSPTLNTANYLWDENADRITLNNSDEGTYYYLYGGISSCNLIVENAPTATESTEEERNEVIAYAKVIRAYNYFVLANYYADTYETSTAAEKLSVPLITSANISAPYRQVSIAEIYDFILKDIQEAIDGAFRQNLRRCSIRTSVRHTPCWHVSTSRWETTPKPCAMPTSPWDRTMPSMTGTPSTMPTRQPSKKRTTTPTCPPRWASIT